MKINKDGSTEQEPLKEYPLNTFQGETLREVIEYGDRRVKEALESDVVLCKGCYTMKHPHIPEVGKTIIDKHIIPDDDSTTRIARPCKGCGWHQTIAGAVLNSKEWKLWRKHASEKMLYDIDECEMIDAMSDSHFRDFIKFTIKNYEKEIQKQNRK
jgi:hypothetical protein